MELFSKMACMLHFKELFKGTFAVGQQIANRSLVGRKPVHLLGCLVLTLLIFAQ